MATDQSEYSEETMVEIPYRQLDPEILRALIEEFVTRDGADWDENGCTLCDKVEQVTAQLARGKIKIFHDLRTESTNIFPAT